MKRKIACLLATAAIVRDPGTLEHELKLPNQEPGSARTTIADGLPAIAFDPGRAHGSQQAGCGAPCRNADKETPTEGQLVLPSRASEISFAKSGAEQSARPVINGVSESVAPQAADGRIAQPRSPLPATHSDQNLMIEATPAAASSLSAAESASAVGALIPAAIASVGNVAVELPEDPANIHPLPIPSSLAGRREPARQGSFVHRVAEQGSRLDDPVLSTTVESEPFEQAPRALALSVPPATQGRLMVADQAGELRAANLPDDVLAGAALPVPAFALATAPQELPAHASFAAQSGDALRSAASPRHASDPADRAEAQPAAMAKPIVSDAPSLLATQGKISASPAAERRVDSPFAIQAASDIAPLDPRPQPAGSVIESTAAKLVPAAPDVQMVDRIPLPEFGPPVARLQPAAYVAAPQASEDGLAGQHSGPGQIRTLDQAVAYGYETNPRLAAGRASVRSADFSYPAARAAYGPRLDAVASLSFTRDRSEVLPGSYLRSQGWTDTASLILSQPLLTFGRNKAAEGEALAEVEFQRESLRLTQNDVMISIIGSYVGVLREAGAVTIARENVKLLENELAETSERFRVREVTSADLDQVRARLSLGRTTLLDAQAALAAEQARFYRAVGMPPGELAPPIPLEMPVSSLPEAYAVADRDSPLIRAAQAREKVSRAILAGAKAERAPMVALRGTADYGAVSDYSNDLRATRLRGQLTLSMPLIDSGSRSAEIGRAEEANEADWRLMEAASRDARVEVAAAWNSLLSSRTALVHFSDAVRNSEKVYEGAQLQERAGMRTTLELLDLARDLLDVRNRYNMALADEYLARVSLMAAMGALDPQMFSPGLELYDPAEHFRQVSGKGDVPLLTGMLSALDGVTIRNLSSDRPNADPAALAGTGAFTPDQ